MMKSSATTSDAQAAVPDLVRRLMAVLAPLAGLMAAVFMHRPALAALSGPLWQRLMHVGRRIASVRFSVARRKSRAGEARLDGKPERAERTTPRVRLDGRKGWLIDVLGYRGAAYRSQLEQVLDDPAMRAVIDAAPGFGRVLRPVCWMLGISRDKATAVAEIAAVMVDAEGQPVARRGKRRPPRQGTMQPSIVLYPPAEPIPRMSTEMAWAFAKMR